ncbi:MAG: TIGR01777 family oxidoreductase [Legionellaceae bacterium]|nr:TIGR01777 family oxidoreductase [Legionellaceae bacterium]
MVKPIVRVLIGGGGITGLTLANLLQRGGKHVAFDVKILESHLANRSRYAGIGGGIGLWPPSQSVLSALPGYKKFIQDEGYVMPSPSYRDVTGRVLAKPNEHFEKRFPVQCIDRDGLSHMLLAGLKESDSVKIHYGAPIEKYERDGDEVVVKTQDGQLHRGDILVACDGIHSVLRNQLMSERQHAPVHPTDLGYTYFRANVRLPENGTGKWWSSSFETWGHAHTKAHGQHAVRFGYVPLKPPHAFWFIALKTQVNHPFLSPLGKVKLVDEDTKSFLKELVSTWQPVLNDEGDAAVCYQKLLDSTSEILRTDISKIEHVDRFPWRAEDNRVVLLGDAAHATAPNIAQGAGLCIEDAATLVSKLDRVDYLAAISEYEMERKHRAKTVQTYADAIAIAGQTQSPVLQGLRNGLMRTAIATMPTLQKHLFEGAVSHSLGGTHRQPYWWRPMLFSQLPSDNNNAFIDRVFDKSDQLAPVMKSFKRSLVGGSGYGQVTVETSFGLPTLIVAALGMPKPMKAQPFYAEVTNLSPEVQRWTRVFADKTAMQQTFATTHATFRDRDMQVYLSEGIGGWFDKVFRFIYSLEQGENGTLHYTSQGVTFFDQFKLPLPECLLPKSEWTETPTAEGWTFQGKLTFPGVESLLRYSGDFKVSNVPVASQTKRLIIAGGTGMIGEAICEHFIRLGYDVYCLSRNAHSTVPVDGVKVRALGEDWSDLINNKSIIVNLSGSNPGSKRWTTSVKTEIAESRYAVIQTIQDNIARARDKPLKYLQASATGIYGDRKGTVLTERTSEQTACEAGTQFRIDVCEELEKRSSATDCSVVNLRIGHVLSNEGGLLPYLRWAGLFGTSRMGSGEQYVPFIHIKDIVRAVEYIAEDNELIDGTVNLTAPESCTNKEILTALRPFKWSPGVPLPESVLKLMIGQSSVILTDSERVKPERLLEHGFEFEYETVTAALNGLK